MMHCTQPDPGSDVDTTTRSFQSRLGRPAWGQNRAVFSVRNSSLSFSPPVDRLAVVQVPRGVAMTTAYLCRTSCSGFSPPNGWWVDALSHEDREMRRNGWAMVAGAVTAIAPFVFFAIAVHLGACPC